MSPFWILVRKLTGRERRGAQRKRPASLVTYYWDGAAPTAQPVRDVSVQGIYVVTEQRWYPKTLITMRLQKPGFADNEAGSWIEISAVVTRAGGDGVGFRFVSEHDGASSSYKALKRFVQTLEESDDTSSAKRALLMDVVVLAVTGAISSAHVRALVSGISI